MLQVALSTQMTNSEVCFLMLQGALSTQMTNSEVCFRVLQGRNEDGEAVGG
jgi:hypothetical protein